MAHRIPATDVPEAWAVGEAMLAAGLTGPVLHVSGREHREELALRLGAAGVEVEEVVCYGVEIATEAEIAESLRATDLVLIGSHRVIERAARLRVGEGPGLICLGPATAATARSAGWEPAAVAESPTTFAVIEPIRTLAPVV